MKEHEQILELWADTQKAGNEAVLATVVKTQGSSYRLSGARLLLTQQGQRAGSISGGCLEDDLVKRAWWMTEAGAVLRRYDTTPEGEITREYGLGCNGVIHVLLERVKAGQNCVLDLLQQVREIRRPAAIVHLLQPKAEIGHRLLVDVEGKVEHNLTDSSLQQWAYEMAQTVLSTSQPRMNAIQGPHEIFAETIAPPIRLLIFGAGDDAVPLSQLAHYLGWQVSVYDGRAHYARREKFPTAQKVRILPIDEPVDIETDRWTVAVLMSHSYTQDLHWLRQLVRRKLPYLGILGPRKRTRQLLEEAEIVPAAVNAMLRSPMGLDIGADGPEQVALAVIAEVQAVINGRNGGALCQRPGTIHADETLVQEPEQEQNTFGIRPVICA